MIAAAAWATIAGFPRRFNLHFASEFIILTKVSGKPFRSRRSGCPVSISLELFGDRWTLLIVRDLMVRGYQTFKEFEESGEGIATNILASRLRRLQAAGIVVKEVEGADRRKVHYRLTEKGIDLAPAVLELLIWGARHEATAAPCGLIEHLAANRQEILAEVWRRWQVHDLTPLIPRFGGEGGQNQRAAGGG